MPRRYDSIDRDTLIRAARLALLPGVTREQACERFGLSRHLVRRAVKDFSLEALPSRRDLVLHALTDGGARRAGELPDLGLVASYVDYNDKDGSTADSIRELIDELCAEGRLVVEGSRWRLIGAFP